jgi:hypothetical protein
MSPTRELATQTEKVVLALGQYMNIQAHACIGGKSIGEDIRKLDYGVHIVSGTPGRVFDMIKRRNLRTRSIKVLVLVRPAPGLRGGAPCSARRACRLSARSPAAARGCAPAPGRAIVRVCCWGCLPTAAGASCRTRRTRC